MNLMKGALGGTTEAPTIKLGSNELAIDPAVVAASPGLAEYVDSEIVIGIRPEDIEDAGLEPDAPEDRVMRVSTSLLESLGSEIILHFPLDVEPFAIMDAEFEGEDAVTVPADVDGRYPYVARVSPRSEASIGESIDLLVDTARVHFFDPATGAAIRG